MSIDYKIFLKNNPTVTLTDAGTSLALLWDSVVKYELSSTLSDDVTSIEVIYHSGTDAPATLSLDAGAAELTVQIAGLEVTPKSSAGAPPDWPKDGGCTWTRNATSNHTELSFTPPEVVDSALDWVFNPATPGLKLKVKIKRQD